MPFAGLLAIFNKVESEVIESTQITPAWEKILELTGLRRNSTLNSLDLSRDAADLRYQLTGIFGQEPIPSTATFLYFGLYDAADDSRDQPAVGFYVAGGTASNPVQELDTGEMAYFPKNRLLRSVVLDKIKDLARDTPDLRDVLEYVVLFGATAILVRNAVEALDVRLPVYVGFDSGDYTLIRQ